MARLRVEGLRSTGKYCGEWNSLEDFARLAARHASLSLRSDGRPLTSGETVMRLFAFHDVTTSDSVAFDPAALIARAVVPSQVSAEALEFERPAGHSIAG